MSAVTRPFAIAATATSVRHSARCESYCTTESVWLAAVTAAAVSLPTTKVSFAPDSGAAGEEAERFTAISAAAHGDQPSGSRPASDCPPTDVAVTGVPGV